MQKVNEKPKPEEEMQEENIEGKLIEEEVAMTGKVNLSVYKYYARSIGHLVLLVVFALYGSEQGLRTGANIWLRQWSVSYHIFLLT